MMRVKKLILLVKLPRKQLQVELMQLVLQVITLYRMVLELLLMQVRN
jgi:hypothetical protein